MRNLQRALELHNADVGGFPVAKLALTPATPCCKQLDHVCAPNQADWAEWQHKLDFTVDERSRFQYSYTSDGKTVTATAVGDMLCDGHVITFTLRGKLENGRPVIQIAEPR